MHANTAQTAWNVMGLIVVVELRNMSSCGKAHIKPYAHALSCELLLI